jgi:hypothetical protein
MIGERWQVGMIQTPEMGLYFLFQKKPFCRKHKVRGNSSTIDRRSFYLEYRRHSSEEYSFFDLIWARLSILHLIQKNA